MTVLHDGPTVAGDAWNRVARRLISKARQTAGGPPAWIRLEVDGTLFALTNLRGLTAVGRLDALAANTAAALADAPHVLGVLLAVPPEPGRLDATAVRGTLVPGSVLVGVPLPGGWGRATFTLPNPAAVTADPLGPASLLAHETGWLDWALDRFGHPPARELLLPAPAG